MRPGAEFYLLRTSLSSILQHQCVLLLCVIMISRFLILFSRKLRSAPSSASMLELANHQVCQCLDVSCKTPFPGSTMPLPRPSLCKTPRTLRARAKCLQGSRDIYRKRHSGLQNLLSCLVGIWVAAALRLKMKLVIRLGRKLWLGCMSPEKHIPYLNIVPDNKLLNMTAQSTWLTSSSHVSIGCCSLWRARSSSVAGLSVVSVQTAAGSRRARHFMFRVEGLHRSAKRPNLEKPGTSHGSDL
ncbi:hypothetical protein BR93DRAFT_45321 [Coniochaeta sp. PMI_546]|nr:hypothetical protein BR93DRAFT_45321 [Coniochaeta sp. PMI_546]